MDAKNPEQHPKKTSRKKRLSEEFKKLLPESSSGYYSSFDSFIREAKAKYGQEHVDRVIRSYVFENDGDSKAVIERIARRKSRLDRNENLDLASFDHFTSYFLITASSIVAKDPKGSLRGVIADALPELLAVVGPEERDVAYQKMSILKYERRQREKDIETVIVEVPKISTAQVLQQSNMTPKVNSEHQIQQTTTPIVPPRSSVVAVPNPINRPMAPSTTPAVRPNIPTISGVSNTTTGGVRVGTPANAHPANTTPITRPSVTPNLANSAIIRQVSHTPSDPISSQKPMFRHVITNPITGEQRSVLIDESIPMAQIVEEVFGISAQSPAHGTTTSNTITEMRPNPVVSTGSANTSTAIRPISIGPGAGANSAPVSQTITKPTVTQTQGSTQVNSPQTNKMTVDLSESRRIEVMNRLNQSQSQPVKQTVNLGPLRDIKPCSVENPAPSQ